MKYTCEHICSSIHFDFNSVRCCCSNAWGPVFTEVSKINEYDFSLMKEIRQEYINSFEKGIIPESCTNCYRLVELQDDCPTKNVCSDKINTIYVDHWRHCNCSCVYCDNLYETNGAVTSSNKKSHYYDLMPMLNKMAAQNLIDDDIKLTFLGGDCTILEEFEDIVNLLKPRINMRKVYIHTSGVKYSSAIGSLLKEDKCYVTVSLDCGCEQTYNKIKRVPNFYNVIKTVQKYLASAQTAKDVIILKYIIINGINDNNEEIKKFLNLAKDIGVKYVQLDVDHRTSVNKEITDKHKLLYDYFNTQSVNLGFDISYSGQNDKILEKGKVF